MRARSSPRPNRISAGAAQRHRLDRPAASAANLDGPLQELWHMVAEPQNGGVFPAAAVSIIAIVPVVAVVALLLARFGTLLVRTAWVPAALVVLATLVTGPAASRAIARRMSRRPPGLTARLWTVLRPLPIVAGSRLTGARFLRAAATPPLGLLTSCCRLRLAIVAPLATASAAIA